MASLEELDPRTPVYVDRNLGEGEKGEIIAQKLVTAGFGEVYLATGENIDDLPRVPWVKGVRGKMPPWVDTKSATA